MEAKDKIMAYLEQVGVPFRDRLHTKSADFIFDLGVFIVSPLIDEMPIREIRENLDFLLNFDSFDEATDSLEKRLKDRKENKGVENFIQSLLKGNGDVKVQVIDLRSLKGKGLNEEEFQKLKDEAKQIPGNKKISELLSIANKLGKDLSDSKQFDRLSDLEKYHNDWFNEIYVFMVDLMKDGHHKECGCVAVKYDLFVNADNRKDCEKSWKNNIM